MENQTTQEASNPKALALFLSQRLCVYPSTDGVFFVLFKAIFNWINQARQLLLQGKRNGGTGFSLQEPNNPFALENLQARL